MTVNELIEMLRQCEPSARVALVDASGIFELTGVQQTADRDAVFLSHVSTGFEAALGDVQETPREAAAAIGLYTLTDEEVMRRIRERGGAR